MNRQELSEEERNAIKAQIRALELALEVIDTWKDEGQTQSIVKISHGEEFTGDSSHG